MPNNNVALDIMEFIEQNILPKYAAFDKAHNLSHANSVITRSITLARRIGANLDMCYVIAAYHDLGLEGPRAIHHITSGKIIATDVRLRRWFSPDQIKIMREAVEDHRASASHAPRSIYGKIVAEADRDLDPTTVFTRAIEYGLDHYPEKSYDGQWQRFVQHMTEKYSNSGYIKLWISDSPNEARLKEIRETINNTERLRAVFDSIYNGITSDGQAY